MSNLINAIKIDVVNKKVELVKMENSLKGAYACMECGIIERVANYDNGKADDLYVDEEGMINDEPLGYFACSDAPDHLLAGNGMICGSNDKGEWTDVNTTVEAVKETILFYTPKEV